MISGAHKLAAPIISELIEEARDAEICRNIAMMREALAPVWPDTDREPDYAGFDTLTEARLLRLSGFLLSFIGKSCNRPDYHLRAKDLLSAAINLFGSAGKPDEEAEANIMLALAYWHAGEVEECEAILDVVERDLSDDPRHPVYLQACINRLMTLYYSGGYEAAERLIQRIAPAMAWNADLRLLAMYHNQAGLVYDRLGQFELAELHLDKALHRARQSNNKRFEGLFLNNRAVLELSSGKLDDAMTSAGQALDVFRALGDRGWLPHVMDTRAQILLELGQNERALDVIDESVELFRQGSDHAGLCEAKWTRVRILLSLGRSEDALLTYGKLFSAASTYIGPTATSKYTRLLVDELGVSENAADIDRLKDLCVRDGNRLLDVFLVRSGVMSRYGVSCDCAVPVRPLPERELVRSDIGKPVIYVAEGKLNLDRIDFDDWARMYMFSGDPHFPTPISESTPMIGEAIGYCPLAELTQGRMEFNDFPPA